VRPCVSVLRLVLLAAAASSCTRDTPRPTVAPSSPGIVNLDAAAQQQAGITVVAASTAARAERTEAPGVLALDERRTARIGSLVEGITLETMAEVGDRVKAGQVLATMHSQVVHETWASYRKAIAERRRQEKQLAFAVAAHERAKRLYADKAVSTQDVQRAEAERVAAEEAFDMSQTEVRRAEEQLEHLGITNGEDPSGESGEQIPVKTPIAGAVLERLVTPGTTVTPGTQMYVVSDLSALWALVEIDESVLSHVRVGQPIELRVAAYPAQMFEGSVALVGDTVNPKTRRVTVRCALANADGRLKPQMYATAVILESAPREAVVLPAEAVQMIAGTPTVFVAEANGRFRARQVESGSTVDGLVEIRRGVSSGERVVTAGSFVLKSELLKSAGEP
jgi:cobalt-zinc-cadmium efflux system membrane fusion protein